MARLKKRVKKRLILITFILAVILLGVFTFNLVFKNNEGNIKNPIKNILEKEDPIKTYTAKLIATGDGLVHSPLYNAAYNSSTNTYDFSNMLTLTKEKIKNYDIKYYNQETVFDTSSKPSSYPVFNTPSAFGQNMIDAGFNLVSLSSNHSMDMGANGARLSAEWWESQNDILATGMASSEEKRNEHKIMNANGITYTMLSYTYGTNGLGGSALSNEPYLVNLFSEEKALEDIAAVRDKVDILIVSMHWGDEYRQTATEKQRAQAKFLADNGVDIILGTHSHCIEPWEWIDDTVVFYSFGNFISNQMGAEQAMVRKVGVVGMFATLDITKTVDTENDTTTIKIDNIGADLNYSYRYYNNNIRKNDYLVIPFSKMESKYLNNYESVYNEFSEVLKTYDSNIFIEPLPSI